MFCNSAAGNLTVLLIRSRTRCQVTQVGDGDTGSISLQDLKLHGISTAGCLQSAVIHLHNLSTSNLT